MEDHHHRGVAGMMYVHEEDLDLVSEVREVECETCDMIYTLHAGWQLPTDAYREQ